MRRSELVEAAKNVLNALEHSKMFAVAEQAVETRRKSTEEPKGINADLLEALNAYSLISSQFGKNEKDFEEAFGVSFLTDTSAWPGMLTPQHGIFEVYSILSPVKKFIPKILQFIEQESVEVMKHNPDKAPPEFQGKALLTLIIPENSGKFSSPNRLVEALEAIELFYDAIAVLNGDRTEQKMIVLACDSGSDKSFDLLGIAKLVESVKEIILALWDRVIFYREKKLATRIDLIAQSLPVIERIAGMEQGKTIGKEQGELLRRKIAEGVGKFINAGAIIPEIDSRSHFSARQLMAPQPKLLAQASNVVDLGTSSEPAPAHASQAEGDDLSGEELEEVKRIYKQLKRKKSKKSEGPSTESAT